MTCLVLAVLVLPFIPVFPGSAIFETVEGGASDRIVAVSGLRRFMLKDGKLYVLRQQTWHASVLTTFVRRVDWTVEEIQEIRRRYPQLSPTGADQGE